MTHPQTEPHDFKPRRGLWNRLRGICDHCYAPPKLHPRKEWVRSRPIGDDRFIDATAPHFKEGW